MLVWSLLLAGVGLAALFAGLTRYWLGQSRPRIAQNQSAGPEARVNSSERRGKAPSPIAPDPDLPPEWDRAPGWEPPRHIPEASKFAPAETVTGTPQMLDYADPSLKRPTRLPSANASTFGLGCLYTIPASVLSVFIIWAIHSSSLAMLLVPGVLLGVPFVVALFFRGWRAFSLAILIAVGIVFLILGICAVLPFGKI